MMISCEQLTERLRLILADPSIYLARNGAVRLGPLLDVGKFAYTHVIFPSLPPSEIESALADASLTVPDSYRQFLSRMNGAILFQGGLSIFGIRGSVSRDPEIRKPFDVIEANTLGRTLSSKDDECWVGSYDEDGSKVWMTIGSSKALRRAQNGKLIAEWESIDCLLDSEIERLARMQ